MTLALSHDDKGACNACALIMKRGQAQGPLSLTLSWSIVTLFIHWRPSIRLCHREADCMVQGACDATGTMGHDYSALGGFIGMGPDGAQHVMS